VVNQHFLFFLDQKEPRDSIPVSLGVFWGAFLGRTFPWTLFLPIALFSVVRSRGTVLVLAWAAGVLALFSAATSRLEHYALPALPAVALLVADLFARWRARRPTVACLAVLAAALAAGIWAVPALLIEIDWLPSEDLIPLARLFFAGSSLTAAAALVLSRRQPLAVVPILAAAILLSMPLVHRGLALLAPFNSSAPLAALIEAEARGAPLEVIFEAPIEYQQVAGLGFYLRRTITLLRPPGFVEPPYLVPHRDALFIDRVELRRRWSDHEAIFVSDPLADPDRPLDEIVPEPFRIIGRFGNRWVVTNSEEQDGE
jgi:4-amino-4-deoxy-L-arabinose transferase-like glycosyltransferase